VSFPPPAEDLLEKFVDHIAGVGLFEEDFLSGNLAEEDADAADPQAVEALERTLQALDVALPFRQGALCGADAALGLRGQGAEPVGDLIRGRNFHRRGSADGIGFCRPWRSGSRSWRRDRRGCPWFP